MPLPIGSAWTWWQTMAANLAAPLFLSQSLAGWLARGRGCIINLADIHALRPLKNFPVYSISKAGLVMLTRSLARELAPEVRVNAIAPGAILWPEGSSKAMQQERLQAIPMKRSGATADIAEAAWFLACLAHYTTGQLLAVDGGASL